VQQRSSVVFDTNVLLSAMIRSESIPARAVERALLQTEVFISDETFGEFSEVVRRAKFDRYFSRDNARRETFIKDFVSRATHAVVSTEVSDCKDPKDNKFLSLAVSVNADFLVSGDKRDLLSMNPFRGIQIVNAATFVERMDERTDDAELNRIADARRGQRVVKVKLSEL
jgi:uncharacterized protein